MWGRYIIRTPWEKKILTLSWRSSRAVRSPHYTDIFNAIKLIQLLVLILYRIHHVRSFGKNSCSSYKVDTLILKCIFIEIESRVRDRPATVHVCENTKVKVVNEFKEYPFLYFLTGWEDNNKMSKMSFLGWNKMSEWWEGWVNENTFHVPLYRPFHYCH